VLGLVTVGRLSARVWQHCLDHRLVRSTAVEVHLHRDGVDGNERQPPDSVGVERTVTHPALVGLQLMQRHRACHRLGAPREGLVAKRRIYVRRDVRRQRWLEGELHRLPGMRLIVMHEVECCRKVRA
jgi:hypothetical protein